MSEKPDLRARCNGTASDQASNPSPDREGGVALQHSIYTFRHSGRSITFTARLTGTFLFARNNVARKSAIRWSG